jgi:hypothetical protein
MRQQLLTIATMAAVSMTTWAAIGDTCEDFQNAQLGGLPANWCGGGGNNDFGVEGDGPGGGVLRLFGNIGSCWGACVTSPISSDDMYQTDFTIECDVRNGAEALSGCHPYRASLEMKAGCHWSSGGRSLFMVNADGTLTDGIDPIGSMTLNTWHHVAVRYTRLNANSVQRQYWLDGQFLTSIIDNARVDEEDFTQLMWTAQEGTVWLDNIRSTAGDGNQDFEAVAEGDIPDNWCNGGGNSDFGVVFEGVLEQVLRLYGSIGGCWGAVASHPVTPQSAYQDDFLIHFNVRNGSEALSGCHPLRASLDMKTGCTWQTDSRRLLHVESDGTLSTGTTTIGWAPLNTWYTVAIRYTRLDAQSVRIQYWLEGQLKATVVEAAQPHESDLTHLMWGAQEGTVWFDDICISEPRCPADTNGDGQIDVQDVLGIIDAWHCEDCYAMDVTGDGTVDVHDLLAVLSAWGGC